MSNKSVAILSSTSWNNTQKNQVMSILGLEKKTGLIFNSLNIFRPFTVGNLVFSYLVCSNVHTNYYGCTVLKFSHTEYTFHLANKWPIPLRKKMWYKSKEKNNESIDIAKITIFTLSRKLTYMFTSFPLKDYRVLDETLELGFNFSSLLGGNYTL